ncbi:hypothetical protein [Fibrivirga algicola]|uniref:Uncharacterized protein n=1 Tax=Fibrivirga algicola TaxID=2950420 RepID=A0ABX0QL55_9BACT|nr:hypothetical protein [Fibrivirga algicola]NID11548.1 hypothetical protein [Fibrivirga algicola]
MRTVEILTALGLTTATQVLLLIVIGYFGRSMIKYFFSENIEIKKMELNNELETKKLELNKALESHKQLLLADTEIYKLDLNKILESHKSELGLLNAKYSKLHDKQSEVIAHLYRLIVKLEGDFRAMTAFMKEVQQDAEKEENERIKQAGESFNAYSLYYSEHKIFFNQVVCAKLDSLREKYFSTHWDYTFNKRWNISPGDGVSRLHMRDTIDKTIKEEIPEILKNLESDFREILTVK